MRGRPCWRSTRAALTIEVRDDKPSLLALCAEFDAAFAAILEPNVFYESWMLAAAIEAEWASRTCFVVVRDAHGVLLACLPMLRDRIGGIGCLRLWQPEQCFLCTPPLAAATAAACIDALLDWCESGHAPASFLDLQELRADGAFAMLLADRLARRARWRVFCNGYRRAAFVRDRVAADWTARRDKDWTHRLRQLAKSGDVVLSALEPGDDAAPWIERFLALESAGWKGRNGTALASTPARTAQFRTIAQAAHRRGRLHMLALARGGEAIAMRCDFLAGDGAYSFKIAFDERLARLSPGTFMEVHTLRELMTAHPHIAWMDSCAHPSQASIHRVWPHRIDIVRYRLGVRHRASVLPVIVLRLRRRLVSLVRGLRDRWRVPQ